MRRFLSRSSTSGRLVGVLALSVVVPGLVLAWYGMQAVLQEDELYRATLRTRAEGLAAALFRDLGDRMRRTVTRLDETTTAAAPSWTSDPDAAAGILRDSEPLAAGVLVLDGGGKLRFPEAIATSLVDRIGGESAARAYLRPLLRDGEQLEREGEWDGAAAAYGQAIESMPGQRGQAVARLAAARCLLKAERWAEALAAYETLAEAHSDDRDLNDFPVAPLARLQSTIALQKLGRSNDAASRLVELLDTLRCSHGDPRHSRPIFSFII